MASSDRASTLLMEEYFSSGDDRFLDELRKAHDPKKLAAFADRWKKDFRPWARSQVFRYLELPLDRPGHQPVVRRLFKHAEEKRDDELMGAFAVAFDRLVRRVRRRRYHYDWETRRSWEEEVLFAPRDSLKGDVGRYYYRDPKTRELVPYGAAVKRPPRLFGYHTRYYLRRRAWRYFRRMGHQRPKDFPAAVAQFLARYGDEDAAKGENILDNWSLTHACFRHADVIEFDVARVYLKDGRGLSELRPAPDHPDLWKKPESARVLLSLLTAAKSRLVRVWAMELLRRDHKPHLAGISPDELLRLLDHADDEVQQFGAELLEGAANLEKMPVSDWLRLLKTRNVTALETITRVMLRHVAGSRLTLAQCVELATAEPVPVARIGLEFLKGRTIATPADRETASHVYRAKCAGVGRDIARWALGVIGTPQTYDVDQVSRFFDSLLAEVRLGAWDWLVAGSPGWDDPALWGRLLETPYEESRLRLVEALERRAKLPGVGPGNLAAIWSAVLLGVHRGGRHKLTALRQISDAVRASPENTEKLLPVLAVAIRSVRLPETRAGLAALAASVQERPELRDAARKQLSELEITEEVVPA